MAVIQVKNVPSISFAVNLMSVFVFDLAYSKELPAVLIFVQNYIFEFQDSSNFEFFVQKVV